MKKKIEPKRNKIGIRSKGILEAKIEKLRKECRKIFSA